MPHSTSVLLLLALICLTCACVEASSWDVIQLKQKPRAIIGYVSDKQWAFIEFLCMTHASWRYSMVLPGSEEYKVDLIAFTHPRYARQVATICEPLDLQLVQPGQTHPSYDPKRSQCFAIPWATPDEATWHGYPFINNVAMFADRTIATLLEHHYGMAMKTDFDTFITPTFLHFWPDRFTFGIQDYVLEQETADRLEEVADTLDLPAPKQHNLGPTWYGDVFSLLKLARTSIPIMHHIITEEFEQLPEGGIKQAWHRGEGWPTWSAGMGALYASELAATVALNDFMATPKMDAHGDSDGLLAGFYHVHARHGDKDFSKFDFFEHHYDHIDVSRLDVSLVRDYCTFVAVSSWRQLMDAQGQRQAAAGGGGHEEL